MGTRVLDEYIGGCEREAWYKLNGTQETNPRKDRLVRSDILSPVIKSIYIANIKKTITIEQESMTFKVQFSESDPSLQVTIDAIAKDTDGSIFGIMIHIGGGIAFRNEVFGTKYSSGNPKDQDIIQTEMALVLCPIQMDRIELLYIDRGMMDDITHAVKRRMMTTASVQRFLSSVGGKDIPSPSYEKDWTNMEKVARLYADKRISKDKYETFKTSHVGGDWQCLYCPFLGKCYDDDRSLRLLK